MILLIGGTGVVGTAIKKIFSRACNIVAPNSTELNVFSDCFFYQVEQYRANIIIYTVGYAPINNSSDELIRAYHINTRIPCQLAEMTAESNARLVLFSSDAIFPGGVMTPYNEYSNAQPKTLYALTKYGADSAIEHAQSHCYTVRLSRVFGPTESYTLSPVNQLVAAYFEQPSLNLVDDVFKSFTYSMDVAVMVGDILQNEIPYGIYHIANSGFTSMYGFFLEIEQYLKREVSLLHIPASSLGVEKVSQTSLLNSVRIPLMRSWQEALSEYCTNYLLAFSD